MLFRKLTKGSTYAGTQGRSIGRNFEEKYPIPSQTQTHVHTSKKKYYLIFSS